MKQVVEAIEAEGGDTYIVTDGRTFRREDGTTPNGNNLKGAWVLREANGQWIDHDRYRTDLAQRNGIALTHRDVVVPVRGFVSAENERVIALGKQILKERVEALKDIGIDVDR